MSEKSLYLSILFVNLFIYVKPNPLVEIPNLGKIEGRYENTLNGRTIHSFEGVPYAKPPVGKYRFQEPVPPKPWKGTWKATTIYRCMQYNQYTPPGEDYVVGDEDCLYVNIYTPKLAQNSSLDVVIYIHGGSFMFNYAGLYRPDYILDKDIVYVTFNYRLGPLGFLSTESKYLPGNNGLRDQILALQFIKQNIQYFGGNPNSITLTGNSAGGVSVQYHYLSPKSRNLFNQGWSLSGSALVPWGLMEKPFEKTQTVAASVGCVEATLEKIVKCLKKRPARLIVSSVKELQPWLYLPFSPFGPVVDTWAEDPVLPDHPYNLLKNGYVYDVPWIVSYTSSEGLYPAEEFFENRLEEVENRWNELMPLILDYNYTVEAGLRDEVSEKIRRYFLGDQKLNEGSFDDFVRILSERLFVNDIQKAAKLQASVTKSGVYSYQFGYRGKNSWFGFKKEDGGDYGPAHADDVPYLFKLKAMDTTTTKEDRGMIEFFVEMIASYAKTGKPEISVEWPTISKDVNEQFVYLKIASAQNLSIEIDRNENGKFWESLPISENEKIILAIKDEL